MKTTLTNYQLMNSLEALHALMQEHMPAATSFAVDWNAGRVEQETTLIAKKQQEILKEHAEWDEKAGRPAVVNGDVVWKNFEGRAEWEALMAVEHPDFEYRPINPSALGRAEVPPVVFRLLKWMFQEATQTEQAPVAA